MSAMVDRHGMRGGAAISGVVLLVAFVFDWRAVVPAVAVVLGIGAAFGPRRSPLGAIYRSMKNALRIAIPVEPEDEAPPRFAQLLGAVFLALASVGFVASAGLGWVLALVVAALQLLLATTGICVGCQIYLYGKRLAAKGA